MSDNDNIVEIESKIRRRSAARMRPRKKLKQAELRDIAASETLVLATAIGQVVLSGLEMKERRKLRRLFLLIVGGLVVLMGIARLMMQLIHLS